MDQIAAVAHRRELPRLLEWVRMKVAKTLLDNGAKIRLELALEEAIVNVIVHGGEGATHSLTLTYSEQAGPSIQFELFDDGPAFNPLESVKQINKETPLEEREPGGLGILLMQQCVDSLIYRREEDKNVLTFVKNLSDSQA